MASPAHSQTVDQWTDPRWRLNNLYTIIDKKGNSVPFRMNGAQEQLFDEMWYLNIILKARQRGFTTFILMFMLDACVFNSNTQAGVVAHNLEDAKAFFRNKVKYPYDQLDEAIKLANPAVQDAAGSLSFANNSALRVGTSLRSGTYQYLHISEHGKICARYPEKAQEIKTGALNTVQAGQFIFIESTAEGRMGDFHRLCKTAQNRKHEGRRLSELDFKFHFFPWWEDPDYVLEPEGVPIGPLDKEYFKALEAKGITLSSEQKAWYVAKQAVQEDDMKQEYPATPEEAFEGALAGAYFTKQMSAARKAKRVGVVPFDPRLKVNTFWDLGLNDDMVIWLHQQHQKEHRFIGYYENSGEGFAHYAKWLQDWSGEREAIWGKHFAPHDIEVRSLDEKATTRKESAAKVGIKFETVPAPAKKADSIQLARNVLALCWFDAAACEQGLAHLDAYRKDWNEKLGVWRDEPRHDASSHGSDGFQTFAIAESENMIAERVTRELVYSNKGLA